MVKIKLPVEFCIGIMFIVCGGLIFFNEKPSLIVNLTEGLFGIGGFLLILISIKFKNDTSN